MIIAPGHTYTIFSPDIFPRLVKESAAVISNLRNQNPRIEALAATGHSGLLLMGALSHVLQMPQIAVRRGQRETQHNPHIVNGFLGCKGYLIVDDLIDTGATIARIRESINRAASKMGIQTPSCEGIFLYSDCDHPPGSFWKHLPIYGLEKSL